MAPNNSVLTDYAYDEILRLIISAEIKPGARIREDLLAEQMGISRTPVREAVNRLTQNGFITSIKRKGLYCIEFTRQDLLDLLDLRIALETLSFEKCIDLASNEDIDGLQHIIDDFRGKFDELMGRHTGNIEKEIAQLHNEHDVRFHVGITRISNSAKLVQYVNEVENMLLISRHRIYSSKDRFGIVRLCWDQHQEMADAIRSRNKTSAGEALKKHRDLMWQTHIHINETDEEGV
jgi:DNA-binding GntR family transcriptional regulator